MTGGIESVAAADRHTLGEYNATSEMTLNFSQCGFGVLSVLFGHKEKCPKKPWGLGNFQHVIIINWFLPYYAYLITLASPRVQADACSFISPAQLVCYVDRLIKWKRERIWEVAGRLHKDDDFQSQCKKQYRIGWGLNKLHFSGWVSCNWKRSFSTIKSEAGWEGAGSRCSEEGRVNLKMERTVCHKMSKLGENTIEEENIFAVEQRGFRNP